MLVIKRYYVYCILRELATKYDAENEKEGKVYVEELKAALDGQPALARRSEKYLELALTEVCGYYVRKQNYKATKDILVFFKKLLPENEDINRRLSNAEKRMSNK
jgi:hypothetical protein